MAKVISQGGRFIFFTDPAIERALKKSTADALSKWGAFVRRSARQSIKKRKRASLPGEPPHSHEGSLKRLLNFYFDTVTKSVVVGPEIKANANGAPNTLEFGGDIIKGSKVLNKDFRVGDYGPIRTVIGQNGRKVYVWTKLQSSEQCKRAKRLFSEYARANRRVYRILPRPYMRPALLKNLHIAPLCFKASLKGN